MLILNNVCFSEHVRKTWRENDDTNRDDNIENVVNFVDYQNDAITKQAQAECEDISDELYQKNMEWVRIFKQHNTPSHENQDERVVTDF